jgi:hypothetical protein
MRFLREPGDGVSGPVDPDFTQQNKEFAISQGQYFNDINQRIAEARAAYKNNPFGKPLPELSSEDITPRTPAVGFTVTPGGGSLPWTSVSSGANTAEFPLAAWYKSKVGAQQFDLQKQNAWNKLNQEPYGIPEFQHNVDKAWNGQVMDYSDDKERQYGAQRWHEIVEGGARTKQEQEDARNYWIRFQSVNNMASMQRTLGDSYKKMEAMEAAGKSMPPNWREQFHNLATVSPHLDKMDDEDVMQQYNKVYQGMQALPNLVDTTHKFLENPTVTTEVNDAVKANGGKIPDVVSITKKTFNPNSQLDVYAQTMMQSNQRNPIDPNPEDNKTVEGMKQRFAYWKQFAMTMGKNETEVQEHNLPKNMILEKQEQSGRTLDSTAGQTFDIGEGNTLMRSTAQKFASITPVSFPLAQSPSVVSARTGHSESQDLGKDAQVVGFSNMPVTLTKGGQIHILGDEDVPNAKNYSVAPMAVIQRPKMKERKATQQDVDNGTVTSLTQDNGNPRMIKEPTDEQETFFVPISTVAGNLIDRVGVGKEKSIRATMNSFIQEAEEQTDVHGSASDKNYFKTHYTISEEKKSTKPQSVKGFHYAR